jgi:cytochrome c peroxidase
MNKRRRGMKTLNYRNGLVYIIAVFVVIALTVPALYAQELKPLSPLPIFPENPITPEKVELGKKLFFDRRLSGDGTMACATCHNPGAGYSDGLAISLSYPTTRNWRNAGATINLAYNDVFFWDGPGALPHDERL